MFIVMMFVVPKIGIRKFFAIFFISSNGFLLGPNAEYAEKHTGYAEKMRNMTFLKTALFPFIVLHRE